jgi:PAS domain S-box-containing protein
MVKQLSIQMTKKQSNGKRGAKSAPAKSSSQVAQTSEMLRLLIENIVDYAIIMLDTGGHVLTWNSAAERMKGWKANEIIGQHFSRFYTSEQLAGGRTQLELETATAKGRFEDEDWRVRKDGSRFWANVIITALRDAEGNLRGFGKVTRDLSERRLSEQRITQQAAEIMEMATVPIVPIWEGVVLAPLIGMLDSQRSQKLTERLLTRITESGAQVALLDITGVPSIDTNTAQLLIETISAVRLVGAEVVLTGVRPVIAQTLVHLGIDLSNVLTRSGLAAGLRMALATLNLAVMPQKTTLTS